MALHIYLATELTETLRKLDDEEEGLISKRFSIEEFESMIVAGAIKVARTANVYGLAMLHGLIV